MRTELDRLAQVRSILRRRAWQRYGRRGLKLAAAIALMVGVWLTTSRFVLATLNPQSPTASVCCFLPVDTTGSGVGKTAESY